MNTGATWPSLIEAKPRVLAMQTKLHQWARPYTVAIERYRYRGAQILTPWAGNPTA